MLLFWSAVVFGQTDIQSLGVLPATLEESSGLIFYGGRLITHNDSGNLPELYELDPTTLAITRTVVVNNAENIDWEDLTQDENYIYIGDFGNNSGDRTDLQILRISKADYEASDSVSAVSIGFIYEDQTTIETSPNSDFDAEAFIALNDELIIFTKQWQSQGTVAYRVPNAPGSFLAERMGQYQVNGLVTGASYDTENNRLFLVGYSNLLFPFFVLAENSTSDSIFGTGPEKTNLSNGPAQVEAITYTNDLVYLTSESFSNGPLFSADAQLYRFTLDSEETIDPEPIPLEEEFIVFKSFNSSFLEYELETNKPIFASAIYDSSGRMLRYTPLEFISERPVDISMLQQGLYYFSFFYGNKVLSRPFFRD